MGGKDIGPKKRAGPTFSPHPTSWDSIALCNIQTPCKTALRYDYMTTFSTLSFIKQVITVLATHGLLSNGQVFLLDGNSPTLMTQAYLLHLCGTQIQFF